MLGAELWHQLQTEPAAAELIGIPERERQIMADWYACTWVDVRDCELKAETRRGVVPDLLFHAVMVRGSAEMSGGVMVPFVAEQTIGDVLRVFDCDGDLERVHACSAEVCCNTGCMRVLRKCAGRCHGAGDQTTDAELRAELQVPGIPTFLCCE